MPQLLSYSLFQIKVLDIITIHLRRAINDIISQVN
jgi:hypothetical protein